MGPTQVSGFGQLAVTCMKIPSSSLIDAISDVTRCAASSCHDGKKNGDDAGFGNIRHWLDGTCSLSGAAVATRKSPRP